MVKRYLTLGFLIVLFAALNFGLPILFPGLAPQPVVQNEDDNKLPPEKNAKDKKSAEKQGDARQGEKKQSNQKEQNGSSEEVVKAESADEEPGSEKTPPEEDGPAVGAAQEKPAPRIEPAEESWIALGSVDPTDKNPYRMLVTLTSRGAAIRRIELSSPQYLELDDRSGYLGHLVTRKADVSAGAGLLVQLVGPGTPASEAGLQAGDILQKLGGESLKSSEQLRTSLSRTKPGQNVELGILRGGKPQTLTAKLRRLPLCLTRPEIENLRLTEREPPPGFTDPPSMLLTLHQLNDQEREKDAQELAGFDLREGHWELIEPSPSDLKDKPTEVWNEAAFRRRLPGGVEIIKRYRLAELKPEEISDPDFPGYHLVFDLEFRNKADEAQELSYELDGPTGLPVEGWWYGNKIGRGGAVGVRDMVGEWYETAPVMIGAATIAEDEQDTISALSMMYAGIDAQYFSAALIPQKKSVEELWFEKVRALRIGPQPEEGANLALTNITVRMLSNPLQLAKSGDEKSTIKQSFTLFAGPKKPKMLALYAQPADPTYTLSELIYYGWPIWGVVAKVMTTILHAFYSVVGNYGLAIIMLTVMVRGCMFPLSRKQALNMVKMQELKPEMDRIQAKYKNEMDKRSKAMQELFRKNNYNPMGGCVLMVLQLPIFLGLYRALMIDVELRQAPLFTDAIRWCSNLAGPDMLLDWSGFMPDAIVKGQAFYSLGPYFNILPIVTVGLFLFQQKMFMPPATDETTAMQQKMMKYMMVFMGFMFYKVASGLCLYFIASTLWGMTERKFLPKSKTAAADAKADNLPAPATAGVSENGASGGSSKKKNKKR